MVVGSSWCRYAIYYKDVYDSICPIAGIHNLVMVLVYNENSALEKSLLYLLFSFTKQEGEWLLLYLCGIFWTYLNRTRCAWGTAGKEKSRGKWIHAVIWRYRWYLSLSLFFFLPRSNCSFGAFGRYCLVSRIVIAKGKGSYVFNTLLLCCDLPVRKVSGCKTRISRIAGSHFTSGHTSYFYHTAWCFITSA